MSLAVEESFRQFLEKYTEAAVVRTEVWKPDWIVEDDGPEVSEELQQLQEDDEC